MLFRFGITTPASTASTAKLETDLVLVRGIIHRIEVQFPPGPNGTLHLHINNALHQVFPYNTDEAFASSDINISFQEHTPLLEPPFMLRAYTWNDDTVFDHLIIIRIGILPARVVAPWLLGFSERLQNLIGSG